MWLAGNNTKLDTLTIVEVSQMMALPDNDFIDCTLH